MTSKFKMLIKKSINQFRLFAHTKLQIYSKDLFIRFTARAFRKLLPIYVFSSVPFGFEGRISDLIVSVPDHCLSFYFPKLNVYLSAGMFFTIFGCSAHALMNQFWLLHACSQSIKYAVLSILGQQQTRITTHARSCKSM